MKKSISLVFALGLIWGNTYAFAQMSVVDSKHNLSSSGPGEVKAISEDRICIFCHTPHNATPLTPLWNRSILEGINYVTYDSSTFDVNLSQPSGPSRLCLSCHDGTVALGAVLSVPGGIAMQRELTGRSSMLGTDLGDDHPFSFSFSVALAGDSEIQPTPPDDLRFYNGDVIHCSTCHDPHDDVWGMFLAVDNRYSGLCVRCHNVEGWTSSAHESSNRSWNGMGNDPWPLNARLAPANQRNTVAENGCENCHTPHNAGGRQRLMRYQEEEKNCLQACHNGNLGGRNVAAQFQKFSTHPTNMATIGVDQDAHDPTEDISVLTGHVECQDCHDPHSAYQGGIGQAPLVSGSLANVSGIDSSGIAIATSQYEYEICFKCHAASNTVPTFVTRYIDLTDTRLEFASTNPSYHPVVAVGQNTNVPSLPSAISLNQTLSEASSIYCTDCHSSDNTVKVGGTGPNGPHGSIYEPILRENYERSMGTPESTNAYALCYRCHDRDNILADFSFRKQFVSGQGGHSGHISGSVGTPCSVCHDPHGIVDDFVSGDHTNLINFDSNVVSPAVGQTYPIFSDNGQFSGSCTLICHGVAHDSTTHSYP